MRTVDQVIAALPSPGFRPLPAPAYNGASGKGIALAVESMKRHVTSEGWEIMAGLEGAGYSLYGARLPMPYGVTNVPAILLHADPGIVLVQDEREWSVTHMQKRRDFRDRESHFHSVGALGLRPDLFKLTILKDAHQDPAFHAQSMAEMGCHAVITYYAPKIVRHLAPYVRENSIIRTWHTVDPAIVPPYSANRDGCLLSGAITQGVYPLRHRILAALADLPKVTHLKHPGYHANGCQTPEFLRTLSRFKVAICTSSIYGYALRKHVEAVAAGCIVVTDLPTDDVLPMIDDCLVRVRPDIPMRALGDLLRSLMERYDPVKQEHYATLAKTHYDYRAEGKRLAQAIEKARQEYRA